MTTHYSVQAWLMCMAQVVVVNTVPSFHSLPAIHVSQMVQCLARARIWQRVCHFSFACEQWLGPVSHLGVTQMYKGVL